MTPRTIIVPGKGTQTATYTLPPGLLQYVQSVLVQVDATAAADVRPTLSVADQSGVVIATKRQGEPIPAGDTGSATWALRLTDEIPAAPPRNDNFPNAFPFLPVWDDNAGQYVYAGVEHGSNVGATQDSFWDPSPNQFAVSTGFFDSSVWWQGVKPSGVGLAQFNFSFTPQFDGWAIIFFPQGGAPPPPVPFPGSAMELWQFVDDGTWLYTSQPVLKGVNYANNQTLADNAPFFFWIASQFKGTPNHFERGSYRLAWSFS